MLRRTSLLLFSATLDSIDDVKENILVDFEMARKHHSRISSHAMALHVVVEMYTKDGRSVFSPLQQEIES